MADWVSLICRLTSPITSANFAELVLEISMAQRSKLIRSLGQSRAVMFRFSSVLPFSSP
jgi:hypothetical protein